MASSIYLKRSNSTCRIALLCDSSSAGISTGMEALKLNTKRKKKFNIKKKKHNRKFTTKEVGDGVNISTSRFHSIYHPKFGGCSVVACDDFEGDCMPRRSLSVAETSGVECFSNGVSEVLRKNTTGKMKVTEQWRSINDAAGISSLPDDVLEMILIRLPLTSLMAARCVCKKLRRATTTPHFVELRSGGAHRTTWLFLFGVKREQSQTGEIHALDVSLDQWYRIGHGSLNGRSIASIATIGAELYFVGGCSLGGDSNPTTSARNFVKALKDVSVFSPLTGSWRTSAPMKSARSSPVLGVFEVSCRSSLFRWQPNRQDKIQVKSKFGAVSEVYEDPHRFSARRKLGDALRESDSPAETQRKPWRNNRPKLALIAVGGRGSRDETLVTGEVYDPAINRWVEIASLPGDFVGPVCSGAVCGGVFYVYSEGEKLVGFDLEHGFWVTVQTSGLPPGLRQYNPRLMSCGARMFLLCVSWYEREGHFNRRENAVRKLWELDLALSTWNEVSRHPDAPMDCDAVFVADGDKIYGVEMFKMLGKVLDFLTACDVSGAEPRWTRVSRKHVVGEVDASSCTGEVDGGAASLRFIFSR